MFHIPLSLGNKVFSFVFNFCKLKNLHIRLQDHQEHPMLQLKLTYELILESDLKNA